MIAPAQPLADDQDVGHGADLFGGEHRAGPPEAARDLVEHREARHGGRSSPWTRGQKPGGGGTTVVQRIGSATTAATVAFEAEHVVDIVGEALEGAAVIAEEAHGLVERRHMLGAGEERPDVAAEQRLAAHRDGVEVWRRGKNSHMETVLWRPSPGAPA